MSRKGKEFPESVKKDARMASDGVCCFCHQNVIMAFHHINPELTVAQGRNEFDNCAPLCDNCHDIYGDNPKKRKTIKEERNRWHSHIKLKRKDGIPTPSQFKEIKATVDDLRWEVDRLVKAYNNENYEETAKAIRNIQATGTYARITHLRDNVGTNFFCPHCNTRIGLIVSTEPIKTCPTCGRKINYYGKR